MASPPKRKVFISYSHKDKKWFDELIKNLKPYERDEGLLFEIWSDQKIRPGQLWRKEIEAALVQSSAAILLVTQDFLASDFIAKKELQPLLSLAESKGLEILWLAVSGSTVGDTVIAEYQALHSGKPLDQLRPPQRRDEFARIASKIAAGAGRDQKGEAVNVVSSKEKKTATAPKVAVAPPQSFFRKHNFDAFPEIKEVINRNPIKTATLIQMSCLNEMHLVRELWRSNAQTDIYLSSGNPNFGVSKWQQERVARFLHDLKNELQNISDSGHTGQINVYQYDAPASIRAVLVDDKILTCGHYVYQKHAIEEHGTILDVRGAELPLMYLRKGDPDFEIVRKMILRMLANWKKEKVARLVKTYKQTGR